MKKKCFVKIVNGKQFVFMPDGTELPLVKFVRVTQTAEKIEMPIAIVGLYVDLVGDDFNIRISAKKLSEKFTEIRDEKLPR
jgi:hypothetical protein